MGYMSIEFTVLQENIIKNTIKGEWGKKDRQNESIKNLWLMVIMI